VNNNIVFHALHFDAAEISAFHGKVTIHAQTVTIDGEAYVPQNADWTFITREFYIQEDTPSYFSFSGGEKDCTVQYVTPSFADRKLMLVKRGGVTIYTERMRYWGDCTYLPGEPESIPLPSVDQAKLVTMCSKFLGEDVKDMDDLPFHMLESVMLLLTVPGVESLIDSDIVLDRATQTMYQMKARIRNQYRYVPYLSHEVYNLLLDELYRASEAYNKQIKLLDSKHEDIENKLDATELMVHRAYDLAAAARIGHNQAEDMLQTSAKAVTLLEKQFTAAKTEVDAKQKDFEKGYILHGVKKGFSILVNFVKAIANIVKGAIMVAAGNTAGVSDILSGVGSFAESIADIYSLVRTLMKVVDSNKKLMAAASNPTADTKDMHKYIKDLDKAADLRVQIVHWDILITGPNILLSVGDIATITGCREYRYALSTLAHWGRALTEETIRQATLIRETLEKKALLKARTAETSRISKQIGIAREKKSMTQEMRAAIYFQSADVKMTLADTLNDYCRSYFYYQFRECSPEVKPRFDDSIDYLQRKVNTARIEALQFLGNLRGNPQPFGENITIMDTVTENCLNVEDCPITRFKVGWSIPQISLWSVFMLLGNRLFISCFLDPTYIPRFSGFPNKNKIGIFRIFNFQTHEDFGYTAAISNTPIYNAQLSVSWLISPLTKIITLLEFFNFVSKVFRLQYE
jgi:hypothetical protein